MANRDTHDQLRAYTVSVGDKWIDGSTGTGNAVPSLLPSVQLRGRQCSDVATGVCVCVCVEFVYVESVEYDGRLNDDGKHECKL